MSVFPRAALGVALALCVAGPASAHFGMVIPSRTMIAAEAEKNIEVDLLFRHPFEGSSMHLARPKAFALYADGKKQDLLPFLTPAGRDGYEAWKAQCRLERPGLAAFVMEPQPYWEEAENKYILHLTKSYVAAFGEDEGWDKPLGLETEIVPLCAPYGLYAGNVFQGRVLVGGKPAPGAEVEVEYYSEGTKGEAPGPLMITQGIRADANGVFTYAAPKAGWWGFAALSEAKRRITRDGKPRTLELGAVIWVRFYEMK
jgi:cobalt/nickel transport protein